MMTAVVNPRMDHFRAEPQFDRRRPGTQRRKLGDSAGRKIGDEADPMVAVPTRAQEERTAIGNDTSMKNHTERRDGADPVAYYTAQPEAVAEVARREGID